MPRMYTRTGDRGETGLFSGERIPKNSLRVEAYGTIDELSSTIGHARSQIEDREIGEILEKVQRDLFLVGAELATRPKRGKAQKARVTDAMVKYLEDQIDRFDAVLPSLSTFIIPAGVKGATALHVARTVARRAERRAVALAQKERMDSQLLPYLNRLSSLLFVLARIANQRSGADETIWTSRPRRT